MITFPRQCPGLPWHPPGPCPNPAKPGDRYCPSCRAEFDSTPKLFDPDAADRAELPEP